MIDFCEIVPVSQSWWKRESCRPIAEAASTTTRQTTTVTVRDIIVLCVCV